MNDAIAPASSWRCYAHPAAGGGKECGHVNAGAPVYGPGIGLECCQKCGCTRIASESRRRRKEAA